EAARQSMALPILLERDLGRHRDREHVARVAPGLASEAAARDPPRPLHLLPGITLAFAEGPVHQLIELRQDEQDVRNDLADLLEELLRRLAHGALELGDEDAAIRLLADHAPRVVAEAGAGLEDPGRVDDRHVVRQEARRILDDELRDVLAARTE